jgi:hypothetical protein
MAISTTITDVDNKSSSTQQLICGCSDACVRVWHLDGAESADVIQLQAHSVNITAVAATTTVL